MSEKLTREQVEEMQQKALSVTHNPISDRLLLAAQIPVLAATALALMEENERLREQRDEARKLIDRDRTGLAKGLLDVIRAVTSRCWILDGRGCYEWDDDRYRKEAGWAFDAVLEIAGKALRESGDRARKAFRDEPIAGRDYTEINLSGR